MKTTAIAATAMLVLIAGCDFQQTEKPPAQANSASPAAESSVPPQATAPLGEPVDREQAIRLMHERHEGMEDIGDSMKLITRELKGENADLARVREGAATIARLAPQVTGWFPPGTGPDVDPETHAKAEIWQTPEDFAAKRSAFQQAAEAFNAAAQGSDLAAIRAAHADLGKSCKACHDLYREKDD